MMGFLVIAQTSTGASRNKIRRYLKYCGYQTTENQDVITNLSIWQETYHYLAQHYINNFRIFLEMNNFII